MEIIPGVHLVDGVRCNCYFAKIPDGSGWALIDTGMPRSAGKIIKYAEKMGLEPSDLKTIIITHCHIDHVGSIEEIKKWSGAKVACHEADADYIAGRKMLPMPKKLLFRLLAPLMKTKPVQPDILLKDGDEIAGLRVVLTPGHTPGSICLLDVARGALFSGDLLVTKEGKLSGPPIIMEKAQMKESIAKIAMLTFTVMLPGHGDPIKENASAMVKAFSL